QCQVQRSLLAVKHLPELAVEPRVETLAPTLRLTVLTRRVHRMAFDQLRAEQRDHSERDDVRRSQGQHHCQRQRREQEPAYAVRKRTGKNTTTVVSVAASTG